MRGWNVSSATSSISPSSRPGASRCYRRRSTWGVCATRHTPPSGKRHGVAASITTSGSMRGRRSSRTATAFCRSSPTCSRMRFAGRRERAHLGCGRRQRPRGGARRTGADLPAVLVARRLRNGLGACDRARACPRARRQHRARIRTGTGEPVPARSAGRATLGSRQMGLPEAAPVLDLPRPRSPLRAALVSLRPRQWTKNLLLFAGIVFAAKIGDASRWAEAFAAFTAYCAASSASYLVNDVRDAPYDRKHPVKRARPIARGELSPRLAEAIAALLLFSAFLLVAPLGIASILFLCTFFALQAAYTLALKHVVLLDVMTIGGLFVVRAAAGAAAVEVRISPWLLLCTALLALFLALAKRRGELVLVGAEATPGRPVLEGYSLALVDQLVTV